MAYHEKGTRVRVLRRVIIPMYKAAPEFVEKGLEGIVTKPWPGEEAYRVLLDDGREYFLYDYELEEIK